MSCVITTIIPLSCMYICMYLAHDLDHWALTVVGSLITIKIFILLHLHNCYNTNSYKTACKLKWILHMSCLLSYIVVSFTTLHCDRCQIFNIKPSSKYRIITILFSCHDWHDSIYIRSDLLCYVTLHVRANKLDWDTDTS